MCTDSEYVGWLNNPFAWWVYHPKTRLLRIGFPYLIHIVQRSKSKKWLQEHGNYEPNQPQSKKPYETMQNPSFSWLSPNWIPQKWFMVFLLKMPRFCGFFLGKNPGFFQRRAAGSSGYKLHMACDTFPTSVNHHPWESRGKVRKTPPQKGGF